MDLFAKMREVKSLKEGLQLTDEQMQALNLLCDVPGAKFVIRTPGTEPRLNGVTAEELRDLVRGMTNGERPRFGDLVEGMGGNRKSSADMGKVRKLVDEVPELEVEKGRQTTYTVRLAGPAPGNAKTAK